MAVSLLLVGLMLLCCSQMSSAFVVKSSKFTLSRSCENNPLKKKTKLHSQTKDKEKEAVANVVLGTVEKQLKGESLTAEEASEAIKATDALLEYLDELEEKSEGHRDNASTYNEDKLRTAVTGLDVTAVSDMLKDGLEMDEKTTDAAFWAVVNAIDHAEAEDEALPINVTQMIHHIFDADMRHLQLREKQTTNVTCMQPDESGGMTTAARKMNYIFDDGDHKNLPLTEGRRCEDGTCCEKCSRNIFPTFATDSESNLKTFPELCSLTFNDLEKVSAATILQFVRLVERVRRTIAHEYGLPLSIILPLQAYSRKYVAGTTQKGGGGGEGDFVTLHTDEATHSGYHYSCVLYLSTQGVDFEGGNFVFNDPAEDSKEKTECYNKEEYSEEIDDDLLEKLKNGELPDEIVLGGDDNTDSEASDVSLEEEIRRAGRKLTPFHPTRGAAVIFSSGWENMHEVEKITSGTRYAVPCFFTTCPVPEAAYEQMHVGKPKTDEDIADDWLHLLLAHRKEEPMMSVGRVKELLMKWHYLCTPLSEH